MSLHTNGLRRLFLIGCLILLQAYAVAQYPCPTAIENGEVGSKVWSYSIKLENQDQHLLHVTLRVQPTSAELRVQLPVWNALYQIRDFAEHVNWMRASDVSGGPVAVRKLDKTTWSAPNATNIEYEIVAEDAGPFGTELTSQHAFLNLAQVLVYPVGHKQGLVIVDFAGIPSVWKIGTPLQNSTSPAVYCADSYDHLVDSPVEISNFRELAFSEGGAQYRVLVHSSEDYDGDKMVDTLRKIVSTETGWMQDRPFRQYTFIYHLPHGVGHGGMEHAYSTAIETSAERLREDPLVFAGVSAHEFFHLWNVKRIRPQSLEPIDYTKENYTRALWFSEGVDSTVSDYMLVRAGLLDEKGFLARLASQIEALQARPAHKTQSVEDSSLDAWLEQYPYYRSAERSESYYNKGEIVGVLLDLAMRDRTHGQKSLRDLFLWMNAHYA
ncbi:MAG: M61 family metallopeptidase, partial [Terriglobales bacterium]